MSGTRATVIRYSKLRNDDASTAKKVRSEAQLSEGFDEADRWKDVREGQSSGKQ